MLAGGQPDQSQRLPVYMYIDFAIPERQEKRVFVAMWKKLVGQCSSETFAIFFDLMYF